MNTEQLDKIRARAEAASEGPWEAEALEGNIVTPAQGTIVEVYSWTDADAEFIAAAREDVPALLVEVEGLRAERNETREECGHEKRVRAYVEQERDLFMDKLKHAKADRDRLTAALDRVRALITEWENLSPASGPFPDRVALDVDVEVINPLRAAIEGTDS